MLSKEEHDLEIQELQNNSQSAEKETEPSAKIMNIQLGEKPYNTN